MIDKLIDYLQYPFVQNAIIVGVLIALVASLLGVVLVLKRYSYIGDGLSHVAFGALAIATILNFTNEMPLTILITAIAAVLILKTGQNSKINSDATIAMISTGSIAIGYFLLNIFPVSTNLAGDVCVTLFGSTAILTLTQSEVLICIILSTLALITFIILYNKIFAVTFDEDFARAVGTKNNIYNLTIAIMTAIIIVLAMNLVGSLLISALIIFPSISSMLIFKSFKSVIISSAIIGVIGTLLGILIAILYGTPVGSTIVIVDITIFLLLFLFSKIKRS